MNIASLYRPIRSPLIFYHDLPLFSTILYRVKSAGCWRPACLPPGWPHLAPVGAIQELPLRGTRTTRVSRFIVICIKRCNMVQAPCYPTERFSYGTIKVTCFSFVIARDSPFFVIARGCEVTKQTPEAISVRETGRLPHLRLAMTAVVGINTAASFIIILLPTPLETLPQRYSF